MRWTNQQPLSLPRMQTFLGLCHARVSPPLTVEGYQVLKRLCGRLTQSNSCIVVSLLVFFSSVTISSSNGNRSNWCQFIVDPLDTEKIDSVACVGGVCKGREGEGISGTSRPNSLPVPFRTPAKQATDSEAKILTRMERIAMQIIQMRSLSPQLPREPLRCKVS